MVRAALRAGALPVSSRDVNVARSILSLCALSICAGACASSAPPPAPALAHVARPAVPDTGACMAAAELRARVPALLERGAIQQTIGVIAAANQSCPESAFDTWAAEVSTLEELGLHADARALAEKIEADPAAPEDARRAAAAVKKVIEGETSRPSPVALVEAGLAARASSDEARARRRFDRAMLELSSPPVLGLAHGFFGRAGAVLPFPDGRSIAVVHAGDPFEVYIKAIAILDTRTLRERLSLRVHAGAVTCLAISPDGAVLASGSDDKTARLWDTRTGALLHSLGPHGFGVDSIAFSPDGLRLATGSHHEAGLWDVRSGARLAKLAGTTVVAFSPKDKLLATGTIDKSVRIWDGITGAAITELPWGTNWVRHLAFSPDGTRLAAGSYDEVRLWDTATHAVLQSQPAGSVFKLHFSPDSARLFSESQGHVLTWDARSGKPAGKLDTRRIVLSSDGKQMTMTAGTDVKLVDVATGAVERSHPGDRSWFLQGGRLVTMPFQGPVHLWDTATGNLLAKGVEDRKGDVAAVAFSPDGKHLAAGLSDATIRRWDTATGALLAPIQGHIDRVTALAYSPDGKLLATGSADWSVRLLDAATGDLQRKLPLHSSPVVSIAFSPDGKLMATSSTDAVRVYETSTGVLKRLLEVLPGSGSSVAFSPDGKFVVAGSGPKVWHWSLASGAVVKPLEGHAARVAAVAHSPDGKLLASASHDDTVRIWDDATGKLRSSIGMETGARSVAFSPDGKVLAVAARDVVLVDPSTGARLRTLGGHVGWPLAVAFSRDGKWLASGGTDGAALLFRLPDAGAEAKATTLVAALHAVAGTDAGYVLDGRGHVDLIGSRPCAGRGELVCEAGALSFPFEVCEPRFRVPGLFVKALAGNTSAPGSDVAPLVCGAEHP